MLGWVFKWLGAPLVCCYIVDAVGIICGLQIIFDWFCEVTWHFHCTLLFFFILIPPGFTAAVTDPASPCRIMIDHTAAAV